MNSHIIISIFHILVVVPFFLYVAFMRAATPEAVYWSLFAVGLFVLLYHGYKSAIRYAIGSSSLWVNLIHVLFIAPLIVYIGYYGKKTPRPAYEILAITAFGALGYHMYSIIMQLQLISE